MFNRRGKKGAIGATMTWVVATIIIFVILMVFLFAISYISKAKSISYGTRMIFQSPFEEHMDYGVKKSYSAFSLTKDEIGMSFSELKIKIGLK